MTFKFAFLLSFSRSFQFTLFNEVKCCLDTILYKKPLFPINKQIILFMIGKVIKLRDMLHLSRIIPTAFALLSPFLHLRRIVLAISNNDGIIVSAQFKLFLSFYLYDILTFMGNLIYIPVKESLFETGYSLVSLSWIF